MYEAAQVIFVVIYKKDTVQLTIAANKPNLT